MGLSVIHTLMAKWGLFPHIFHHNHCLEWTILVTTINQVNLLLCFTSLLTSPSIISCLYQPLDLLIHQCQPFISIPHDDTQISMPTPLFHLPMMLISQSRTIFAFPNYNFLLRARIPWNGSFKMTNSLDFIRYLMTSIWLY